MAENFDFQIDSLKFRAATSDKFPYARATAPFRKEQFDSAPTVGDQSLSGWWTRGQLSFHKGAGVKYYEVLDGEEVLNRSQVSDGVDPWTPGEVVLADGYWTKTMPVLMDADRGCVVTHYWYLWTVGNNTPRYLYKDGVLFPTSTGGGGVGSVAASEDATVFLSVDNKIEYSDPGGGASWPTPSVLWTNSNTGTADDNFVRIWWAKKRLWALDAAGNWYALPRSGGTIPAGGGSYLFWASGDTGLGASVGFAESPGAVFIGTEGKIYSVTLDASGGVPAVTTPTVVGDLGQGVAIGALGYCTGHLVICTAQGTRVAEVAADGSLTIGPPLNGAMGEGCRQVAVVGDRAYLTDRITGSTVVVEVNLSEWVSPLVPAWVYLDGSITGTAPSMCAAGGTNGYAPRVSVVPTSSASETVRQYGPNESLTAGSLTTGYHRFGTLDSKHFHEVLVRSRGEGTIEVFRVDANGTETSLGSMAASDLSASFSFGLTVPVERVALRFELTPSAGGATPILLGYQIKALPSPVRQRLIKWPLLIQDVYRDRYGVTHGKRDGAWDAWSELEALEEADALVTFTDHRTGETGSAFIESLELQTDTPSRGASTGFGGVGYATLRKVT